MLLQDGAQQPRGELHGGPRAYVQKPAGALPRQGGAQSPEPLRGATRGNSVEQSPDTKYDSSSEYDFQSTGSDTAYGEVIDFNLLPPYDKDCAPQPKWRIALSCTRLYS